MIIQSSSMDMRSTRRYGSASGVAFRTSNQSLRFSSLGNRPFGKTNLGTDGQTGSGENEAISGTLSQSNGSNSIFASDRLWLDVSGWNFRNRLNQPQEIQKTDASEQAKSLSKIQEDSMDWLIHLFFGTGNSRYGGFHSVDMRMDPSLGFSVTETETATFFHEEEYTSFSTTGKVVTADGREISFNLEANMSRSFTEATYRKTQTINPTLFCDPLVINLDSNIAEVSDQKFFFDIDADGHAEAISQLGPGSGFLALDKNGDGKINDGSELFGTANGDGFADLARYDSDGNGWIDEADEIFEKLLIWTKDSEGKDVLCGLGKAGVGAIYLGNVGTEFSMNSMENNAVNARVRKTGIFLYENGGTGTVQHVDFAK